MAQLLGRQRLGGSQFWTKWCMPVINREAVVQADLGKNRKPTSKITRVK
jgi:hypothetical protein